VQPPYPPPGQPPFPPYGQPQFQPPPRPAEQPSPPTPPPVPRDVSVMDGLRFTTSGQAGWRNIMFCALLYLSTQLIPILGLIVMLGYFAEVHRRLVLQHPEPYVRFDFSDLSSYLIRGVAPLVMMFLGALPTVLIGFIAIAIVVGARFAAPSGAFDNKLLLFAALGALLIPFLVFWQVVMNAATTRAELTGDVGRALRLGAIWTYAGKTWKRALITGIVLSFAWLGLTLLGLVACIVGVFVTMTIVMIAQLHVRWQIYNEYLLQGGEPIELAPWEVLPSEAKVRPAAAAH
jgi:Protein of unknown function (DUF4013)